MSRIDPKIGQPYTSRNRVKLVHGGKDYFAEMTMMIRSATQHIHLQTYIFDDDETGIMIANELAAASARDVKVYVLLDGYASRHLPKEFIQRLLDAGIDFRYFEPVWRSKNYYFGRRMHHKIMVVDGRYSLVGGINISNRYNDLPGEPAWLDWAVSSEGEVSYDLFKVCLEFWYKSTKRTRIVVAANPPMEFPAEWDCAVKVRRNDWVRRRNQITRSYIEMFDRAEDHIIVMSSYFLPGRVMRRQMVRAAARGVNITLVLAGTSDVTMAKYAERFIYRWMLRKGINIYEYPKCVLHAKLSTYDKKWVTVGSYNVNNISAYASVELNLDVLNATFASHADEWLEKIIAKDCVRITNSFLKTYNTIERFLQWWSYEVYRFTVYIFTFYFKQE